MEVAARLAIQNGMIGEMSAVLIATIAGLITAFCWGSSDWLSARSAKKLSPIEVNFTVQAVSLVIVGFLFLFFGFDPINASQLARVAAGSLLIMTAYLVFVKALSSGIVGIIVPLGNIYPLFTIILTLVFLKVHFGLLQLGAMLSIVLGASLLAYEKNHRKIPLKELHRESILALLAAIIWGVAFFVIEPVVSEVSWQTIAIVSEVVAFTSGFFLVVLTSRTKTWQTIGRSLRSKPALVAGIFGEVGMMALYLGSSHAGSVVIPTVLSAGSPLIASWWGMVVDHEKVGVIKRVGAVVVVAGIIALNVS